MYAYDANAEPSVVDAAASTPNLHVIRKHLVAEERNGSSNTTTLEEELRRGGHLNSTITYLKVVFAFIF